jgi:hypothetical protein
MKDAHATVVAHLTNGAFNIDMTGDAVFLKEASDLKLQGSLGAIPLAVEYLSVGGKSYQRTGNNKWVPQQQGSPTNWAATNNPSYAGEDNLTLGKAWHVKGSQNDGTPFEMWVRESDGYPMKLYIGPSKIGTFTVTFDKFNTGASLAAPVASDIQLPPRSLSTAVGHSAQLTGVTVTVVSADLNATSSNEFIQPKPGNRFVAIEVLYENTGGGKVSYGTYDWKLVDGSGFSYSQSYTGKDPALQSGDLQAGEKARGFITYEVPQTAAGLVARGTFGSDRLSVALQ